VLHPSGWFGGCVQEAVPGLARPAPTQTQPAGPVRPGGPAQL